MSIKPPGYQRISLQSQTERRMIALKQYDVKCPVCGTINRDLYLEETNGWMECEHCHQVIKAMSLWQIGKDSIPIYTPEQLVAHYKASCEKGMDGE